MSEVLIENQQSKTDQDATNDLRGDNFSAPPTPPVASFVKPRKPNPMAEKLNNLFTPEQIQAVSELIGETTKEHLENANYNPQAPFQVVAKDKAPIRDFSAITLDDVYDLSVPIEARPFMSADALTIKLKDTNYEARWVNKNPQNLGDKLSKGFTYIEPADLRDDVKEAISPSLDAEGHFSIHDAVAMKIDKATYYTALRAAYERTLTVSDSIKTRARAANSARSYMRNESGAGGDFSNALADKKISFYDPDIGV